MKKGKRRLAFLLGFFLIFPSCKWVNPTAPKDSILYVSANPMAVKTGGATSVVTVIGYDPAGVPMKDRTIIHFTTDLGTIDPTAEIKNGRATAVFKSGSQSGEAQIYVTSGTVEGDPFPLKIAVGTSALASLILRADPFVLRPGGGRTNLTADAFDKNGNGLVNIPVVFSTNAGALDSGGNPVNTNAQGRAEDNLTTTTDAEVKAVSGSVTSSSVKITVRENKPPVARFSFSPQQPRINDSVNFNGSTSSDEDGTIVSYEWSFGNGGESEGVQATTHYHAPGTYSVTLIVTDNLGAKHSETKSITIAENKLPQATFKYSPASPKITDMVYFNASESYDPDGTIVGYEWDFGDGTKGAGVQPKHQFAAAGTYWVTLTVRDDSGGVKAFSDKVTVAAAAAAMAGDTLPSGPGKKR